MAGNKLSIPRTSVSRGIKELAGKSLTIISQPMLTMAQKEHQLERAKALLNKLKGKKGTIIFSDEKQFKVNKFNNRRNRRYLDFRDTPEDIRYCPKIKNPQSVMVLGAVGSDSKVCPPIFIPKGVTVMMDVYLGLLKDKVIPWIQDNYKPGEFTFQQDSAPAHGSKKTQEFLSQNVRFWERTSGPHQALT